MTDTMTPPEPAQEVPAGAPPMPEGMPAAPMGMPAAPEGMPPAMPEAEGPGPEMPEGAPEMGEIPTEPIKEVSDPIRKIADDYVIPMSDNSIKEWGDSKDGEKNFKEYAVQVACGLYPTFAPQIQTGLPTRVLLDPYVQVAEQVLGNMMSEPNWSDPKWGKALQGGMDPKTGRPVPMMLDEWRKFLMTDPGHGWDKTPEAHGRANDFVDAFKQQMGGEQMGGM